MLQNRFGCKTKYFEIAQRAGRAVLALSNSLDKLSHWTLEECPFHKGVPIWKNEASRQAGNEIIWRLGLNKCLSVCYPHLRGVQCAAMG